MRQNATRRTGPSSARPPRSREQGLGFPTNLSRTVWTKRGAWDKQGSRFSTHTASRDSLDKKRELGTSRGRDAHLAAALVAVAAAPLKVVVADLFPDSEDEDFLGLQSAARLQRGVRDPRKGPFHAPVASPLIRQHLSMYQTPSSGTTPSRRRFRAEPRMSQHCSGQNPALRGEQAAEQLLYTATTAARESCAHAMLHRRGRRWCWGQDWGQTSSIFSTSRGFFSRGLRGFFSRTSPS